MDRISILSSNIRSADRISISEIFDLQIELLFRIRIFDLKIELVTEDGTFFLHIDIPFWSPEFMNSLNQTKISVRLITSITS